MKRTILLADDSPTIQRLVTQTFADADFEIVSVSNGDAALRKLEEIRPQLILADIYMPGKNGYEVCAHVKNHPEFGSVPVVLLVGAFDAFDEESARRAGAVANITKPFEPRALVETVVSLLSARAGSPAEESAPAEPAAEQPAAPASEAASGIHAAEEVPPPESMTNAEARPASEGKTEEKTEEKTERATDRPADAPAEVQAQAVAAAAAAPLAAALEQGAPPPAVFASSASPASATLEVESAGPATDVEEEDLLGLHELFQPTPAELRAGITVSDEEIDRIADRVIQRLSTQIIESVAWDVVPDITTKVLREELKRHL